MQSLSRVGFVNEKTRTSPAWSCFSRQSELLRDSRPVPRTHPERSLTLDGGRLYYEECGNGGGTVVLLHDGVANSAVWDDVWPAFCKQFHTIRYDRRGYGRSPATTKPYYEADDLAAVLRARKVTHAALVASSHGGEVALNFTLRYTSNVSHLVLIGPSATGFPYSE